MGAYFSPSGPPTLQWQSGLGIVISSGWIETCKGVKFLECLCSSQPPISGLERHALLVNQFPPVTCKLWNLCSLLYVNLVFFKCI